MSVELEDNGIPHGISIHKAPSVRKVEKTIMKIAADHMHPPHVDSILTAGMPDTGHSPPSKSMEWSGSEKPLKAVLSRVQEEDLVKTLFGGHVEQETSTTESSLPMDTNSTMSTVTEDILSTAASFVPPHPEWSAPEIGAVTLVILIVPFILCSNLLVILSVIRYRRLHTPTNYFITSLAAVDILVALAVPFVVVIEVFHFGGADGPKDVVLCLLPNRVLMMACGVSVLTLATIAYDRHTALVSPLEYVNIMTARKVAVMVAVTWIYSAVIVWLPLMIGWFIDPSETAPCSSNLLSGKASVLFLGAIFVPSCIAILVCYSRIFLVARHHAKAIAAVEFAIHRNLQVKFMIKDTKYAKTLALVIGFFLALWFPYLIYIFIQTVCHVRFDIWIQTYLILLAVFNSGINPWIYAFKNNEFRAAFKRMFKELCRDRVCMSMDRRASLVPPVSNTPRLSRTDSRMLTNLLESTLDILSEQLKNSIHSLNDSCSDGRLYDAACAKSNTNVPDDEALVSPVQKQLVRHTASCCDLDSYTEAASAPKKRTLKFSRRYSLDFGLTHHSLVDIASQPCSVGEESGLAKKNNGDKSICDISSSVVDIPQENVKNILQSSLAVIDESSSPSIKSSSSNINSSLTSTLPSNTHCSHTPLVTLQAATLHLSTIGVFTTSCYPQHYHTPVSSPSCHAVHPTYLPVSPPPQTPSAQPPSLPYYDPHLVHSFSYINENPKAPETCTELLTSTLHCPQSDHEQAVDSHQILAHTHSCPTFDPLTSDPSRVLAYWERSLFCSYLGTLGVPQNGHNYVSRLGSVDRYSNTKFFI
ncbi:Octopamine receptor beta-2R [Biomphalaria glabrata]|nr:octopamine receptor beta-2R-like [Biomphalaria glabrata]